MYESVGILLSGKLDLVMPITFNILPAPITCRTYSGY
jgi:hypothetical protein